jgi:urea carboxylase
VAAVDPAVVVPANHRAMAFVHHLATATDRRPEAVAGKLRRSLGNPATISDRLLKHRTLATARAIGVRTPPGGTVATAEDAVALAGAIGFPVVLKATFGAGGHGVAVCRSAAEVEAAFPSLLAGRPRPRRPGPRWLPPPGPIDLQAFVDGTPAMSCAVAKEGRVLAVLSAVAVETMGTNGPASVLRLLHHPEIERMTAAMAEGFGASGFISFDFLIDRRTGEPVLVECNPRPIGIALLGYLVGCDLMAAFRAFVDGAAVPPVPATARSEATVALFPRALVRDPPSAYLGTCFHDVPTDEPAAVARFLEWRGLSLDPAPALLEAAE